MVKYKDTYAAKGSQLAEAIAVGPEAVKKVYDDTTVRFFKTYGEDGAKGLLALAKLYR